MSDIHTHMCTINCICILVTLLMCLYLHDHVCVFTIHCLLHLPPPVVPEIDDSLFKMPSPLLSASKVNAPTEKYELATHTVKVRRTGALSSVMALWDLPGTQTTWQLSVSVANYLTVNVSVWQIS